VRGTALAVFALLVASPVLAQPAADSLEAHRPRIRENALVDTLPPIEVTDSFDRSLRRARTSSQHALAAADLKLRPISRPGEILEAVPGLVISQHSGEGKANQYYLRGFNLDHGTDMATFVAGIPVNLPTHAHGQGYSDLNFLIPELVSGIEYKKGAHFAEEGDFGTAGAAHIAYANRIDAPIAELQAGGQGYRRALVAGSAGAARGDLLYALEMFHNDGPWVNPDDYRKLNAVLRWGRTGERHGYRLTAMGYDGRWNSTDQVPDRAVSGGLIPRFGSLDPSDGGASRRFSLSGEWQRFTPRAFTQVTAYGMDYRVNLFSNFTYALDDTLNGDQFEQADRRAVTGLRASHTWRPGTAGGLEHTVGLQARHDAIREVGLHHTRSRQRIATTRQDRVAQTSISPYLQSMIPVRPWLRTTLGLRGDLYWFDVMSDQPLNSGRASASIVSPKLGVSLGPWARTAPFLNVGTGFHSNDARGATITVDPNTLEPAERVKPLVRATAAEVGVLSRAIPRLETALTLWRLDLESELVFVGDAGATEASRPSRRLGIEWSSHVHAAGWLRLDADAAYSRARFTDADPAGEYIPGAVEGVVSAGATVPELQGFFGALRLRYFGPRPLIEDNSVRSRASTLVNAELGRSLGRWGRLGIETFNLFDAKASDIDYFYASRLPGEPAEGIDDIHSHPVAPRTVRLRLSATWPRAGDGEDVPLPAGHPNGDGRMR
jgi:hypothetical protein